MSEQVHFRQAKCKEWGRNKFSLPGCPDGRTRVNEVRDQCFVWVTLDLHGAWLFGALHSSVPKYQALSLSDKEKQLSLEISSLLQESLES